MLADSRSSDVTTEEVDAGVIPVSVNAVADVTYVLPVAPAIAAPLLAHWYWSDEPVAATEKAAVSPIGTL
jgi:hypothetical protein